ncbi:MAG: hypothetical protein Q7W02_28465 [Candidatus Rokubacteria bacterium]|nr:hypothetical protein [Candidatus Rokubacteria bacterium]
MANRSYRLRIARGEQQFEAEGDKRFVLDMLKRFESEASEIGQTPAAPRTGRAEKPLRLEGPAGKGLSPGEFVRQLGFKKHIDLVSAFGYYLEHQLGTKDFTPADLNNLYYEAKIENSNTSQMCISNIRRGYMMESKAAKKGGKKRYTLTQSGEEHVKTRLSKQAK